MSSTTLAPGTGTVTVPGARPGLRGPCRPGPAGAVMTLLEALGPGPSPTERLIIDARRPRQPLRPTTPSGHRSGRPPSRCARAPRPRSPTRCRCVRSSRAGRPPRRRHRPVRRRERRRRLPRARPVEDDRVVEIDADNLVCRGRSPASSTTTSRRPSRARPLVPAGPGQRAVVDHRRQRRHERRRPLLREVRRDPRLRPRHARRHGRPAGYGNVVRSAGGPPRASRATTCRPDGRLGGHARRRSPR